MKHETIRAATVLQTKSKSKLATLEETKAKLYQHSWPRRSGRELVLASSASETHNRNFASAEQSARAPEAEASRRRLRAARTLAPRRAGLPRPGLQLAFSPPFALNPALQQRLLGTYHHLLAALAPAAPFEGEVTVVVNAHRDARPGRGAARHSERTDSTCPRDSSVDDTVFCFRTAVPIWGQST